MHTPGVLLRPDLAPRSGETCSVSYQAQNETCVAALWLKGIEIRAVPLFRCMLPGNGRIFRNFWPFINYETFYEMKNVKTLIEKLFSSQNI